MPRPNAPSGRTCRGSGRPRVPPWRGRRWSCRVSRFPARGWPRRGRRCRRRSAGRPCPSPRAAAGEVRRHRCGWRAASDRRARRCGSSVLKSAVLSFSTTVWPATPSALARRETFSASGQRMRSSSARSRDVGVEGRLGADRLRMIVGRDDALVLAARQVIEPAHPCCHSGASGRSSPSAAAGRSW